MLSWADVATDCGERRTMAATCIHGFVHKMDLRDAGEGRSAARRCHRASWAIPVGVRPAHWASTMEAAFRDFGDRLSLHQRFGGPPVCSTLRRDRHRRSSCRRG